ncbi:MAG: glucosaminidase domain-containing protein [Amphritea sp.]
MRSTAQTTILLFAACMFAIGSLIQIAEQPDNLQLNVIYKPIHSPVDIVSIPGPEVMPIAYTRVTSLAGLQVDTKKIKFIEMMLPAILISKNRLQQERQKLITLASQSRLTSKEQAWLEQQQQRFKAKTIDELVFRMNDMPTSIILAQAAIETGWGTSRFFLEGNNVFGVWSGNPKEPRIRASESRDGKAIYVKKYASLLEAIDDYFLTIGRGGPYQKLRQARLASSDPLKLINYLGSYSELGSVYIERLRSMITHNKLQRYDQSRLAI